MRIFLLLIIFSVCGFSNTKFPFTGKITANKVRVRTAADLDSTIVKTVDKDHLFHIVGEKNGFYAIHPSADIKFYVYKKYVLDGKIDANNVNVRLSPSTNAPILGQLTKNQRIDGEICEKANGWLAISPVENIFFYISKKYVSKIGNIENYLPLKTKEEEVKKLLSSAFSLLEKESKKPYHEMKLEEAIAQFEAIIKGYKEFDEYKKRAKEGLLLLKNTYLQKKIAYLEEKTSLSNTEKENIFKNIPSFKLNHTIKENYINSEILSENMKIWKEVEQELFKSWKKYNKEKTMKDFYEQEMATSKVITGTIEKFPNDIKEKPGSYILKTKNSSKAFLYSTLIDLDKFLGKKVRILVSPRPNNNFAFPAYFVTKLTDFLQKSEKKESKNLKENSNINKLKTYLGQDFHSAAHFKICNKHFNYAYEILLKAC